MLLDGDGVVGRGCCTHAQDLVVDIDSDHRAQKVRGVLGVVPRVARSTAISK